MKGWKKRIQANGKEKKAILISGKKKKKTLKQMGAPENLIKIHGDCHFLLT